MIERLGREWRSRGTRHLLAWIGSLFFRRRSYVLYLAELADFAPEPALPGIAVLEIDTRNFEEMSKLRSGLLKINADNGGYLDDVKCGKAICVTLVEEDRIIHYAFVFLRNKTACILGIPSSAALIGNAYTVPSHRGRGLQAHSTRQRARIARDAGFQSIACETSPTNVASQRGLEKAGMRNIGRMELWILLNCIVIRWRRPRDFRLLGFCV